MRKLSSLFIPLFVLQFLNGCYVDQQQKVTYRPAGCDSVAFRYTEQIEPLIKTNCAFAGCHVPGGEGEYDFTRYEVVADRIRSGRFEMRIDLPADDPLHMPDGFLLDPCTYFKLKTWIRQGFPE